MLALSTLDFSKAFDTLRQSSLLSKLGIAGHPKPSTTGWLTSLATIHTALAFADLPHLFNTSLVSYKGRPSAQYLCVGSVDGDSAGQGCGSRDLVLVSRPIKTTFLRSWSRPCWSWSWSWPPWSWSRSRPVWSWSWSRRVHLEQDLRLCATATLLVSKVETSKWMWSIIYLFVVWHTDFDVFVHYYIYCSAIFKCRWMKTVCVCWSWPRQQRSRSRVLVLVSTMLVLVLVSDSLVLITSLAKSCQQRCHLLKVHWKKNIKTENCLVFFSPIAKNQVGYMRLHVLSSSWQVCSSMTLHLDFLKCMKLLSGTQSSARNALQELTLTDYSTTHFEDFNDV